MVAFKLDKELLIDIGLEVAAIPFLLVLIYGINRLFKIVCKRIYGLAGDKIKGLSFKNYQFLTPKYSASLIVGRFKTLRIILLVIVFYFWLPLIFSIFHWTKNNSDTLIGYTLDLLKFLGSSFVDYLPSLLIIGVVFIIVSYINKIINFFAQKITNERLKQDLAFTEQIIKQTVPRMDVYVFFNSDLQNL